MCIYNEWAKNLIKKYSILTIFAFVFSVVYEYNSHGVYSWYMMGLALYPLIGGVFLFGIIYFLKIEIRPSWICKCSYHSALVTFMVGSCMKGIMDIYGTSSQYVQYYWCIGKVFLIICIVSLCLSTQKEEINKA